MNSYEQVILDNIIDTAWFIDQKGIFRAVNNAFLSLYNCKPEQIIGKSYFDIVDQETAIKYQAEDNEVISTRCLKIMENSFIVSSEGPASVHWMETVLTPVLNNEGICEGLVGISRDITDRKQSQQKLLLANEVIEASSEAIMITDHDNKIIRVNNAFCQLTGYTAKEVYGQDPAILRSRRSTSLFYKEMWLAIQEKGHWQGEIWDQRKDGTSYPNWMAISVIRDSYTNEITNYMAIFTDVTEKKQIENKIRYIAYHDALTGLGNKALFESKLIKAIKEAEREHHLIAVMQLDLDNFKNVNESLGHYVGDELLKAVADIISSCLRASDIVARIGGDEFIVMLDKMKSVEDLKHLGNNILEKFKQPISVMKYTLHITPSIGFSIYPFDAENHEVMLQNADTAMYRAKRNGKNQYTFFNKAMTEELLRHLKIENQLRKAIKKDQFSLHYQPQIRLEDNCLVGVEALIRLNTSDGMISPFNFIPVAEDTGLIIPIGEWVLKTACQDAMRWKSKIPDLNISIAVNLSAHQFEYDYMSNLIEHVLLDTGLPVENLVLEITESTLVTNTNEAIRLLKKLKSMGVHLALDDFGTGYSSLSYLKAFDLDYIKIDRSFVSGIPNDKNDCSITQAIINMAKSLDLKVIAEGAETQEHIDFLKENNCEKVQGYFYGKPMSFDDLVVFMEEGKHKLKQD